MRGGHRPYSGISRSAIRCDRVQARGQSAAPEGRAIQSLRHHRPSSRSPSPRRSPRRRSGRATTPFRCRRPHVDHPRYPLRAARDFKPANDAVHVRLDGRPGYDWLRCDPRVALPLRQSPGTSSSPFVRGSDAGCQWSSSFGPARPCRPPTFSEGLRMSQAASSWSRMLTRNPFRYPAQNTPLEP